MNSITRIHQRGASLILISEIAGLFLVVFTAVYFGFFRQYAVAPAVSPTNTPESSTQCYYLQVQCIRAPCNPVPVCPAAGAYTNTLFGFTIPLPTSWKGYTVTASQWELNNTTTENTTTERGPLITLWYPDTSQQNPHELMPIMVFTLAQWDLIRQGKLSGAAPIPPSDLGRNSKYVLALPARYNYDYKEGWQEVDELVHQLQAFEPQSTIPVKSTEPVFCTQEVKQCPDGSYVGRTGPKCEFAPCPGESK